MQKTKLKAHTNFDINLDAQNALIERSVATEVNLNRNTLKQLEVFAQNRLGKCLSSRTMDVSTTENGCHMALTSLRKKKIII